ncbi:MAG: UDP-N-acetylmuramate dehydrogenase [Planctomycetota bacterium]
MQATTDLSRYNSFRLPARARHVWFPRSEAEVLAALHAPGPARRVVLGGGSNVVLTRNEYTDIGFIVLEHHLDALRISGRQLIASAGTSLRAVCECAAAHALGDLAPLYGIPGSIGGAAYMNAGAYGGELYRWVARVRSVERSTGRIMERRRAEIPHGYRHTLYQGHDEIITEVTLELDEDPDPAATRERMDALWARRLARQPLDLPNAGSVFRRPASDVYVGPMIERLGLKGHRIGGAQVSERHAGFIVNAGGATGADVVALTEYIRRRVREAYGHDLQREQVWI